MIENFNGITTIPIDKPPEESKNIIEAINAETQTEQLELHRLQ